MSEQLPFTIDQFYRFCAERKLMGARCNGCHGILTPPRPMCPNCFSTDFNWVKLTGRGRLLTFTQSYQSSLPSFQNMVPYMVGIVKLEEGPRLPGLISNAKPEDVHIDMELKVEFDTRPSEEWPHWPRYFFVPV